MYWYKRAFDLPYKLAVDKIKEELKKEGFGILTEIDVKETLKKKLGVDFIDYIILGACNPHFAYQALQTERDIGILMPCNVIVYQEGNRTFVAATLPTLTMNVVKNEKLTPIAREVERKLKNAVDNIHI